MMRREPASSDVPIVFPLYSQTLAFCLADSRWEERTTVVETASGSRWEERIVIVETARQHRAWQRNRTGQDRHSISAINQYYTYIDRACREVRNSGARKFVTSFLSYGSCEVVKERAHRHTLHTSTRYPTPTPRRCEYSH